MILQDRISALANLAEKIDHEKDRIKSYCNQAYDKNKWFTIDNSLRAIQSIQEYFLNGRILYDWLEKYQIEDHNRRNVGLVLAGNIPLVGWHDVMCCFLAGHRSVIKYSSKDEVLLPFLLQLLREVDSHTSDYFIRTERLKNIDAVIATGGDTAATHFKYYFGKYPHIIRKNRSSIAILSGQEDEKDLEGLVDDTFKYFGLGCRSISKIYIPQDFKVDRIFEASMKYASAADHNKYRNNYDYNNAMYLLSQKPFLTNDFLILLEDESIASRIACLHYERYVDVEKLEDHIVSQEEQLQCVSTSMDLKKVTTTPFGHCQKPKIDDYADGIDTLQFLIDLS